MKRGMAFRTLTAKISAVAFSVFLGASMTVPAWAGVSVSTNVNTTSATSQVYDYHIIFVDENNNEIASFPAKTGDTYGPGADDTISVRSTYYDAKTRKDYDVVNNSYTGKVGSADITIRYKEHQDQETGYTVYMVASDTGAIIGQTSGTGAFSDDVLKDRDTIVSGDVTYKRNGSKAVQDQDDPSVYTVQYTPSSSSSDQYIFTVQYVVKNADGTQTTLATRTFRVNKKTATFYAPRVFSKTADGVTTWYEAVSDTKITCEPGDPERSATVEYKVQGQDNKSYKWYVLLYSSQTNTCIDSLEINVTPDGATYTPEKNITVDGVKYTINKAFDKQYTHAYSDTNHVEYIYYDPEGYSNSSEKRTKTINIQYVDIANGNVLQSLTQEVTSDGDTTLNFPDSLDVNGTHYLRVQGQVTSVDYNFYSPKVNYTVYYYDENNTQFQTYVITTEEVREVTVNDGTTVYTVLPGITRIVATDTSNGVNTVVATNDATGAQITDAEGIASPAGNIDASENGDSATSSGSASSDSAEASDGTDEADNSQDVSIDGVHADDIQTPQSDIWLNTKEDSSRSTKDAVLMIVGIAALATCIVAAVLLIRRNRSRKH